MSFATREGQSVKKLFILLLCVMAPALSAAAETYPSRSIRLLVPYPPGGIADLAGRLVGEGLHTKFNQPVIIENKPGANGVIGLRELMKSDADGYTLMVGPLAMVINYAMDSSGAADAMRDVVPIAGVAENANAMVVNNKLPVKSVKDFVAYAQENPGKLTYGSTGVGSSSYLATALFMQKTGVKMVHVPYKGGPFALNDLLGGSIDVIIEVFPVVMEQINARAIKALAVSSPYRLPSNPDIPTFEEAGVPDVKLTGWLGVYGPPQLPEEVREKLGAAIVEVVKQPEIQRKFRAIGFEPTGQGVKAFSEHHAAELKRWTAFIQELGLRN
jgi:tripartite-type tricarboxylate transporter receptor subunit TctC